MGKSKTIEQKMEDDKKFRDYMDNLQKDAKKEEDRILGEIDGTVKKLYEGNGWDHARLFGNKQSDYQNYDDWNLNRIINIISSIGTALQGGDFPSGKVPGSSKAEKSTIDNAKDFLGAFTGDYGLIIARVQALVSGVLTQFASASVTTRKSALRDMPMAGGLHLFFGSTGEVFKNNTFFTNQFIGSFQIVFEVYMSVAEARAIGIQQILIATSKEMALLNEMILDIREEQAKSLKKILKENPSDYVSSKAAYTVMVDSVKEDRAKLVEEYDKYNSVIETVDRLFPQLDLTQFGKTNVIDNTISLDMLFNEWEKGIAERYIQEKLDIDEPAAICA